MPKTCLSILLVCGIVLAFAAGWQLHRVITPPPPPRTNASSPAPEERRITGIIGSMDAPVSLRAFISFSSPESAAFALNVLPGLERGSIKDGTLQVIIHDTPEDRSALHASILARCAASDTYPSVVRSYFKNQELWTTAEDPALELARLAMEAGLSEKRLAECLSTTNNVKMVGNLRDAAFDTYRIKSSPAFLITSQRGQFWLEGTPSFREFANAIARLSPKDTP